MTIQSKPKVVAKKVALKKAIAKKSVTKKVASKVSPKKPVAKTIPIKNLSLWQKLVMFLTK